MKKIFQITALTVFLSTSIFAQNLKYKDIFNTLQNGDTLLAYNMLLAFQKSNPYFANTYFQLGNISYKWVFETDPFLDIERTEYLIYNTRLFYGLAIRRLTEDKTDVRKNRKYYQNLPELSQISKLNNQYIINFINYRLKKLDEYDKNVHIIYSYFYTMITIYNNTVSYYRRLISKYPKIKDLYLAPITQIKPKLDTLKIKYDSTLFLYQQYKTAITSYPIKNYNQKLVQKDIKTYRLQGLTYTNFLADTILVWNYDKWAKDVISVIVNDITKLRSHIDLMQKLMDNFQQKILKAPYAREQQFFNFNPKIIYEIEKFDYKSLMSAYFEYRKSKLDFLTFSKLKFNDTTDQNLPLIFRAKNYFKLYQMKHQVDSLWAIVQQRNTEENRQKFRDFFAQEFPQGFTAYLQHEKVFNDNYLQAQFERYKYFIFRDALNYPFVKDSVKYQDYTIPLYVSFVFPQFAEPSQIVVLDRVKDPKGEIYLTGYIRGQNVSYPFLARVFNGQVLWLKKEPVPINSFQAYVKLTLSTDGLTVVKHDFVSHKNTLVQIDFAGKQVFSFDLQLDLIPKTIEYDGINNLVIVVYKGSDIKPLTVSSDPLVIQLWDAETRQLKWTKQVKINGSFVDLVKIDTVYHVFFNASHYEFGSLSKTAITNIIGQFTVSMSGQTQKISVLFDQPQYLIKALKLSNRKINLLCLDGENISIYEDKFVNFPKLKYILLSKN